MRAILLRKMNLRIRTVVIDLDNNKSELAFEEALARLDGVVQSLESGGLSLTEATHKYEEGMKLARLCGEMLASTELRIQQLKTEYAEQALMTRQDDSVSSSEKPC